MRYYIIANPNSGVKKTTSILKKMVKPRFNASKINFDTQITEYPGHATKIVTQIDLSEYDAIIVLGGDGTVHEVVNGILKNKSNNIPPFGFASFPSKSLIINSIF